MKVEDIPSDNEKAEEWLDLMEYIIKHDPSAIAVHDQDLRYIYVSDRYLKDYRVTRKEVIGKHHYDIFPDIPQKWKDIHQRALAGEVFRSEEDVFVREDGSVDYTRWECRPWHHADGTVGGIILYTEVVTERKRIEEALIESENKFRTFVESSGDIIFNLTAEGIFTYVTPNWEKVAGYKVSDTVGKPFSEFVLPEDVAICAEFLGKVVQEVHAPETVEYRVRYKDGSVRWYSAKGSAIEQNGASNFIGIARDITDSKAIELALEQLTRFQQMILQISTEFVTANYANFDEKINRMLKKVGVFFDVDRTYLFELYEEQQMMTNTHEWCAEGIEPQMHTHQKVPFDTLPWLVKQHKEDLVLQIPDIEMLPEVAIAEKNMMNKQQIQSLLLIPISVDGRSIGFFGLDSVKTKKSWSEEHVSYLKVVANTLADAFAKVQAEVALLIAKERAEDANIAKSMFLANMSHEIRTPMNSVLGMTEILEEQVTDIKQKKHLQILKRNGEHLLKIINDILDISKIEAGKMCLNKQVVDVCKMVMNIGETYRVMADKKGLKLQVCCELCTRLEKIVLLDEDKVRQVLINLLGNAVKFTETGFITLSLVVTPEQNLRFDVIDTGIGIAKDKETDIFQAFNCGESKITRTYGGTGLGLTISQQLVQLMGGCLEVESELGIGTRFSFALPFQPLDKQAASQFVNSEKQQIARRLEETLEKPIQGDQSQKKRILLVEDNEDNRLLVKTFLKKEPIQIDIAVNGKEAVEKYITANQDVNERPYSLILMDMQMPVLDGYFATRLIRSWEKENNKTPVVIYALTAYALGEEKQKSLDSGCNGHLTKPIKKRDIINEINKISQPTSKV